MNGTPLRIRNVDNETRQLRSRRISQDLRYTANQSTSQPDVIKMNIQAAICKRSLALPVTQKSTARPYSSLSRISSARFNLNTKQSVNKAKIQALPKTKSRRATMELIPDALSMLIRSQQSRKSFKRSVPVTVALPTMQRKARWMTQDPSLTDLREPLEKQKLQQVDTAPKKVIQQRAATVPRRRLPRKMIHIQIQTEQPIFITNDKDASEEENDSPSICKISSPRYSDIMKPKF